MTFDEISKMIRRHEGTRYDIYIDSVGVVTGGVGHAFHVGSKLPVEVVERLFYHDLIIALTDYKALEFDLSPNRRAVIIDMLFNLGLVKFLGFRKLISAIHGGRCEDAVWEIMDSKYYCDVGDRAEELAIMFYDDMGQDEAERMQSGGLSIP